MSTKAPPKFRKCNRCEKRKPTEKFPRHDRMADGYSNECKECTRDRLKAWRDKQSKAWHEREKKRIREAVRRHRAAKKKQEKKAAGKRVRIAKAFGAGPKTVKQLKKPVLSSAKAV